MIFETLATLLATTTYLAGHDFRVMKNQHEMYKEAMALGAGWEKDPEREKLLRSDLESWWQQGEHNIVPEDIAGFLEVNCHARQLYFEGLAAEVMMLYGCCPMDSNPYSLPMEQDPYHSFNNLYRKSAHEWRRIYHPEIAINALTSEMEGLHTVIKSTTDEYKKKQGYTLLVLVVVSLLMIWLCTETFTELTNLLVYLGIVWVTGGLMMGGNYHNYHQKIDYQQNKVQELAEVLDKPRPYDL